MTKENKNFNVKTFEQMIGLRETFAQNRHKERIGTIDHQCGSSTKLSGTKQGFRKEILGLQDGYADKQHGRKMEQIRAVSRSKK